MVVQWQASDSVAHKLRLSTMIPLLFVAFLCSAALATKDALTPNPSVGHWVDVWSAMPQLTECANLPPPPYVSTSICFKTFLGN